MLKSSIELKKISYPRFPFQSIMYYIIYIWSICALQTSQELINYA